jgi:16S rRNA C967 or C1407 C5-methylase (RsmB/RsmF family)
MHAWAIQINLTVPYVFAVSQVQVVFYCTRSVHYAENEAVVESAMETCHQYCTERNDAIEDKRDHIKHFQLYVPDLVYAMQPHMKRNVKQTKGMKV